MMVLFYFIGMSSAALTFVLQHKVKMNVVLASALPSFCLALLFYFMEVKEENLWLAIVFTASFVGMSATNFKLHEIILGGAISTALLLNMPEVNRGLGGGMGTSAFIAVLLTFGLRTLYQKVVKKAK
ncbi:hypothetical protein [Lishizhenia sp.]|uniref:hypothetical protein n=1 Tax=Lishizhenia sp. TaxID=2497594 RepID=UPI00299DDD27|nr:hypothetical protein [Lishizhenia sp.]MDX1445973.1 hypothetical protein [Lishizhenia sp.]